MINDGAGYKVENTELIICMELVIIDHGAILLVGI